VPWQAMRKGGAVKTRTDLGQRGRCLVLIGPPLVEGRPRWMLFTHGGNGQRGSEAFRLRNHVNGVERGKDDDELSASRVWDAALDKIKCEKHSTLGIDLNIPFDDERWVEILERLNRERTAPDQDI
jgi:hypothetical protein